MLSEFGRLWGGNSFQIFSYFGVWHFGIDLKYFGPKIEYVSRNFKLFSHNLINFGQTLIFLVNMFYILLQNLKISVQISNVIHDIIRDTFKQGISQQ